MSACIPPSEEVAREVVRAHAAEGCLECLLWVTLEEIAGDIRDMPPADALVMAALFFEAAERIAREAGERA